LENKLSQLEVTELKALAADAVQSNDIRTIRALMDFHSAVG